MRVTPILTNFARGEFSPRLDGRTDIEQYQMSARTLENITVRSFGGASNRPGTYFVSEVKDSTKITRIIPFQFSTTQTYILELGDEYIRFYKDSGQIVKTLGDTAAWVTATGYVVGDFVQNGSVIYYCIVAHTSGTFATDLAAGKWVAQTAYEIPSPYDSTEVFDIQFAQSADVLYMVHPSYAPRKLSRTGHTSWTLEEIDYTAIQNRPALRASNFSSTTITPSADTGAGITLTASTSIFNADHVGSIWRIKSGWVKIKTYASGTSVTADVLYSISLATGPAATTDWAEGAWSEYRGYPSAINFYEQRLFYACTDGDPQTIWGSQSLSYENFETGADDTDSLLYTIASEQVDAIQWLSGGKGLAVGTIGGVYVMSSGASNLPLTPDNVVVNRETTYGCAFLMPIRIGNHIFYIQRNYRTVREFSYSFDIDSYIANDMTILSEHITESGILDTGYMQSPDNIFWCVRDDGEIAILTIQIEHKVFAWSRLVTDGIFESVAVIPNGQEDQVWFVVQRYINGSWVRYIEYMKPVAIPEPEDCFFVDCGLSLDNPVTISGATAADPVVVTAASHGFSNGDIIKIRGVVGMTELNHRRFKVANKATHTFELTDLNDNDIDGTEYTAYESGGEARECVSSVSGLDHLEGESVAILVDGAVHPARTVASGAITLNDEYAEIHVGLPYTATILTQRPEVQTASGTAQNKLKRITKLAVRLYESLGCNVGNESNMDIIPFRTTVDPLDEPPELYSGDKQVQFPVGYNKDMRIKITQDQPLPLNVLAIMPVMDVQEG